MPPVCQDPAAFQALVVPHCADPSSDTCALALIKAADSYGPGCIDLAVKSKGKSGTVSYRHYACPGTLEALAPLCVSAPAPAPAPAPGSRLEPSGPSTRKPPAGPGGKSSNPPIVPIGAIGAIGTLLTAGAGALVGAATHRQRQAEARSEELQEQLNIATAKVAEQESTEARLLQRLQDARIRLETASGEQNLALEKKDVDNLRLQVDYDSMRNVAIVGNHYKEAYDLRVLGEGCIQTPLLCHTLDKDEYPRPDERPSDLQSAAVYDEVLQEIDNVQDSANRDRRRRPDKRRKSDSKWQADMDNVTRRMIAKHPEHAESFIEMLRQRAAQDGATMVAKSEQLITTAQNFRPDQFRYLPDDPVHQAVYDQASKMRTAVLDQHMHDSQQELRELVARQQEVLGPR